MLQTAQDAYLESRVYAADPIGLVRLLYQACLEAVEEAQRHLAAGRIAPRARSISKACRILAELIVSLDRERGGEIALRLAALYDYMQRKLIEANFQQREEPLAEVLRLMRTLADGWEGIQARPESASAVGAWMQPGGEPAASHAWSF